MYFCVYVVFLLDNTGGEYEVRIDERCWGDNVD